MLSASRLQYKKLQGQLVALWQEEAALTAQAVSPPLPSQPLHHLRLCLRRRPQAPRWPLALPFKKVRVPFRSRWFLWYPFRRAVPTPGNLFLWFNALLERRCRASQPR